MSLPCYDADAVVGQTITIVLSVKNKFTITDAAAPFNTYTSTYETDEEYIHTVVATRVVDMAATPADDEFRIVTGELPHPNAVDFPLFDQLAAMTNGDPFSFAKTNMTWPALALTEIYTATYTGTGAPANSTLDLSGTEGLDASFAFDDVDQMSWVVSNPIFSTIFSGDFTVDPFTFKKSGSDNFGFTYTNTVPDPGTVLVFGEGDYDVTAWDVETSVTVTVS